MELDFYTKAAIVGAAAVLPFILSAYLTRRWRMPDYYAKVCLVLFCFFVGAAVCVVGRMNEPKKRLPKLGIDLRGGVNLVYEVEKGHAVVEQQPGRKTRQTAVEEEEGTVQMDKLIAVISRRINPGGQKEITLRKYGPGQIEIIIPEADDEEVERIKKKISQAGTLEFRILANSRDHASLIARARQSTSTRLYAEKLPGEEKPKLLAWWVPMTQGQEKSFAGLTDAVRIVTERGQKVRQILVVKDPWDVTGEYLSKAAPGFDEKARPDVTFNFNAKGARLFGELTSHNLPETQAQEFYRHLGIVLDGYLYSAPRIQSAIYDRGQISGEFTQKEVQDLVEVLNAGSLPGTLNKQPISELRTGPTLGSDTIEKGTNAILLSTVVVFVFMIVYYRFSGIIACLAVIMNITVTIAIMDVIKAALTLPGLAGLALTVGMAVDANVLIYERIREEMEKQTSLRMAIRNGFGRAQSAIIDSNLTTLISSIVLYVVGTDQVKGFAVTLTLGVAISMFTAVFCAHVVFDVAERQKWISKLKMMRLFAKTSIDFFGIRHRCYAASLVLITIGMIAVWFRGPGLLDIDFTGGVSVQIVFHDDQDIADIRSTLEEVGLQDLSVSDVVSKDIPPNRGFIINTASRPGVSAEDYLNEVKQILNDQFAGKLLSNTMTIGYIGPERPGAPRPGAVTPEKASSPATTDQGQSDLPPESLLASADPSAVGLTRAAVGQASSGKPAGAGSTAPTADKAGDPAPKSAAAPLKTEPAAAAKPAAPPAAKPPAAPPPKEMPPTTRVEKPAEGKTAPAAGEKKEPSVWATLDFTQQVNYATLVDLIKRQLDSGKFGPAETDFRLFNEKYEEGSDERFYTWDVSLDLPQAKAAALLANVREDLHKTPFFPASNTIGGKVAGSTRMQALYAIIVSNLLIMVYLWVRFERLMYGVAAVASLVHDVLVAIGFLAISSWLAPVFGFLMVSPFKIGLTEVAAILTLVGFSVNDTVVIFDRIREVKGKTPKLTPEIVNASINQTLSRTILTSLTVLLVALVLYVMGGPTIHAFAYTMTIGVVTGTYSSVYVAAPLLFFARSKMVVKQRREKAALPALGSADSNA